MGKLIDLTGQRFGRLVVLNRAENNKHGQARWNCRCDCGNEIVCSSNELRQGKIQSCRCLNSELASERGTRRYESYNYDGTQPPRLTAKPNSRNTSGVRGVSWSKTRRKWIATIGIRGRRINLGGYDDIEDAAAARAEAEKIYFEPVREEWGKNRGI